MKYITSKDLRTGEDVRISYNSYGSGKPVVLIHGWPSSKEMWEYQLEDLVNARLRVVKYDRRGFGKSDKPWDGYDYDTFSADLHALMEELDLRDATLVGFSMGGGEVARYISKYGTDRVSKAVLVGAVTPYLGEAKDNQEGVPQKVFSEIMDGIRQDRIGFLDGFGKNFFGVNLIKHPLSAPLLEHFRDLASVASQRSTLGCVTAFAYTDFRRDLEALRNMPVLIIHGDSDKIVPMEVSAERTVQILPNAQYLVYAGAPHGLFYTHREQLNRDLIAFINSSN